MECSQKRSTTSDPRQGDEQERRRMGFPDGCRRRAELYDMAVCMILVRQ